MNQEFESDDQVPLYIRCCIYHVLNFIHQGVLIPPANQVAHMEWDADFLLIIEKEVRI